MANKDYTGLSSTEELIYFIVTRSLAFISLVPNVILILIMLCHNEFHTLVNLFPFELSITSIFFCLSYCFPNLSTKNVTCYSQAFLNSVFDISMMIFTLGIAYVTYLSFYNIDLLSKKKNAIYSFFSLLGWGLPIIFGLIILFMDGFQPGSTKTCWMSQTFSPYFILIISCIFIINMIYVISLLSGIKKIFGDSEANKAQYNRYFWTLIWYIIAQLVTHLPIIVDAAFHVVYKWLGWTFNDDIWEKLIRDGTKCITGFWFALVYGFTKEKWTALKNFIFCIKYEIRKSHNDRQENSENISTSLNELSNSMMDSSNKVSTSEGSFVVL